MVIIHQQVQATPATTPAWAHSKSYSSTAPPLRVPSCTLQQSSSKLGMMIFPMRTHRLRVVISDMIQTLFIIRSIRGIVILENAPKEYDPPTTIHLMTPFRRRWLFLWLWSFLYHGRSPLDNDHSSPQHLQKCVQKISLSFHRPATIW